MLQRTESLTAVTKRPLADLEVAVWLKKKKAELTVVLGKNNKSR